MRLVAVCVCPVFLAALGCAISKPVREMKPPKTEEFMLPPATADGRPIDPPAYPEDKKNPFTPRRSDIPANLKDVASPGGPTGSGMGSGPIRNGGGAGAGPNGY